MVSRSVLWRDGDGEWRAYVDKCPHRLAPFSEGRINEQGFLECGYHACVGGGAAASSGRGTFPFSLLTFCARRWQFSGPAGKCEVVPQDRPEGRASASPRACATAYQTAVAQGILFVRPRVASPGAPPPPPLPIVPELDDPAFVCIDVARDLPYSYETLLENVLDASHVPVVHHLTVSNRANIAPLDLEVTTPVTASGFEGYWAEGPRRGKLGPQSTKFIAPSLMVHSLNAPSLGTTLTVVYAVPMGPSRCRLMARFPFKFNAAIPRLIISKVPRWMQHAGAPLLVHACCCSTCARLPVLTRRSPTSKGQLNVLEDDQVRASLALRVCG
jgi:hypothetical protein